MSQNNESITNIDTNLVCPRCGYCPHCGRANMYWINYFTPYWGQPYYNGLTYTVTSGTQTYC